MEKRNSTSTSVESDVRASNAGLYSIVVMADDGAKVICRDFATVEKDDPLISFGETPIACPDDLVVVRGEKCTGKSHFAALLMAACMAEEPIDGMVGAKSSLKMLVIDTDQTDRSIALRYNRALRTAGIDSTPTKADNVGYIHLREYSRKEQRRKISEAVGLVQPDIIYIDSVWPLMVQAYSEKNLGEFMQFLRGLTNGGERAVIVSQFTYTLGEDDDEREWELRDSIDTALLPAAQTIISLTRESKGGDNIFHAAICNRDYMETQMSFGIVGEEFEDKYVIL